ncbi:ArsR family transcriptional regulator [Methanolapillus ohkumae]
MTMTKSKVSKANETKETKTMSKKPKVEKREEDEDFLEFDESFLNHFDQKRIHESAQVFSAISSEMRQRMIQMISEDSRHISSIARELGISVPVASKHIKILEDAGLVERKVFGKTHVLSLKKNSFNKAFDSFAPVKKLEVEKGTTLMDAFRRVSIVEVKNIGGRNFIVSADGEEGYFIYEVNGKLIDKRAEEFILEEDSVISWKRLEPVTKKKLVVSVKK